MAGHETDLSALAKGKVTITPLDYNMTRQAVLAEMEQWQFQVSKASLEGGSSAGSSAPAVRRAAQKRQQKAVGHER